LRQIDPQIRELAVYRDFINQGATGMNLIELNRALRQLRLGGIAAVLETRLSASASGTHGPPSPYGRF